MLLGFNNKLWHWDLIVYKLSTQAFSIKMHGDFETLRKKSRLIAQECDYGISIWNRLPMKFNNNVCLDGNE